jgi:SEC-C motif-containing protein
MDGLACPCGLGDDYDACCGRLHAGYLLGTYHSSSRPEVFSLEPSIEWTRLAVLATQDGGLFDAEGTVQFRAVYVRDGKRGVHAETSRFAREDGRWTYVGAVD